MGGIQLSNTLQPVDKSPITNDNPKDQEGVQLTDTLKPVEEIDQSPSFSDTDGIYKGVDINDYANHVPGGAVFINKELDETRAQGQGFFSTLGNATLQAASNMAGTAVKAAGYIVSAPIVAAKAALGYSVNFSNLMSDYGEDIINDTKSSFPIFHTKRQDSANLLDNLSSFNWWVDKGQDVAGMLGMMGVLGMAGRGTGAIAKLASLGEDGIALSKGLGSAFAARTYFNMESAKGVYDQTYNDAIKKGVDDHTAKEVAAKAAAYDFKISIPNLIFDIPLYASMFGGKNILKMIGGITDASALEEGATTKLAKLGTFGATTADMTAQMATQGFQTDLADQYGKELLGGDKKTFSDQLLDFTNSREFKDLTASGILTGALFGALHVKSNAIQERVQTQQKLAEEQYRQSFKDDNQTSAYLDNQQFFTMANYASKVGNFDKVIKDFTDFKKWNDDELQQAGFPLEYENAVGDKIPIRQAFDERLKLLDNYKDEHNRLAKKYGINDPRFDPLMMNHMNQKIAENDLKVVNNKLLEHQVEMAQIFHSQDIPYDIQKGKELALKYGSILGQIQDLTNQHNEFENKISKGVLTNEELTRRVKEHSETQSELRSRIADLESQRQETLKTLDEHKKAFKELGIRDKGRFINFDKLINRSLSTDEAIKDLQSYKLDIEGRLNGLQDESTRYNSTDGFNELKKKQDELKADFDRAEQKRRENDEKEQDKSILEQTKEITKSAREGAKKAANKILGKQPKQEPIEQPRVNESEANTAKGDQRDRPNIEAENEPDKVGSSFLEALKSSGVSQEAIDEILKQVDEFIPTSEDQLPITDKEAENSHKKLDSAIKLIRTYNSVGIQDFPTIIKILTELKGKEAVAPLYDVLKVAYSSSEGSEDVSDLTLDQIVGSNSEINSVSNQIKINEPIIDVNNGEFHGVSNEEDKISENDIHIALNPVSTSDPDLVISPVTGEKVMLGKKNWNSASSLAYLGKLYDIEETETSRKKKTVSNRLNDSLLDKKIFSPDILQIGDKVTLSIDYNYYKIINGEKYTYDSLKQREIEEGKPNHLIPIGIIVNGKHVAYLHDVDWINEDTTVPRKNNVEIQREVLINARNEIVKRGGHVETFIEDHSYGRLAKQPNGLNIKTKDALQGDYKLTIGKSGALYSDLNNEHIIKDRTVINPGKKQDGRIYAILPTPIKGEDIAVPLSTNKIHQYIPDLISATKAHFEGNKDLRNEVLAKSNGKIDLSTTAGLKAYYEQVVYLKNLNKENEEHIANDEDNERYYVDISGSGIQFQKSGGNKIDITSRNWQHYDEAMDELEKHLSNLYTNISLKNLGENEPTNIIRIKEGKVSVDSYDDYNDFIKNHTQTNLLSYHIGGDEYGYFDQPVIRVNLDFDKTYESPKEVLNNGVKTENDNIESHASITLAGVKIELPDILPDELPRLEPKQEEGLAKALAKEVIPSVRAFKQNRIVNNICDSVIRDIQNSRLETYSTDADIEVREKLPDYIENVRKAFQNIVSLKEKLAKEGDLNAQTYVDRYKEVLDHWDAKLDNEGKLEEVGFKELVYKKLEALKVIKRVGDDEIRDEEIYNDDTTQFIKLRYDDNATFQVDAKRNMSGNLRRFLSFIPDGGINHLNLPTFLSADEGFNSIMSNLAGLKSDYKTMRSALDKAAEGNTWVKNLLDKLDNTNQDIRNDFEIIMSRFLNGSKTVLIKNIALSDLDEVTGKVYKIRNSKGDVLYNQQLSVVDNNRLSLPKIIQSTWINNLKKGELTSENKEGDLTINSFKVKELSDSYKDIDRKSITSISDWLNKLGITVQEGTIKELIEQKNGIDKEFDKKGGIFFELNQKLQGIKSDELFTTSNPLLNNSAISKLANIQSKYEISKYASTFRNGENKPYQSFIQTKWLSDQFIKLGDNEFAKQLAQISFHSTSEWLKELSKPNSEFSKWFNISYADSLKTGSRVKSISDLTPSEYEKNKMSLFFNKGQTNNLQGISQEFVSHFIHPTLSDSSIQPIITALKHKIGINFKEGEDFDIAGYTIDRIYKIAEAEAKRIARVQSLKEQGIEAKIDGYDKGSQLFLFLPFLNKEFSPELWHDDKLRIIQGELEQGIKDKIHTHIKDLINDKIKLWEELGIGVEDKGRYTINFIDKDYLKTIDSNIPEKTVNTKDRVLGNRSKNILKYAATDYVINNFISNAEVHQTIIGDPAFAYKGNSSDIIKNIETTFDNHGKRLKSIISPGEVLADSQNNKYKQIFLNDKLTNSKNYEEYEKILGSKADAYKDIKSTDSQELVTVKEKLWLLAHSGKLSTSDYKRLSKKEVFSEADLNLILQPDKPRFYDQIIDPYLDINRPIYIKSSSIPLIPQLTHGLEIDKLRVAMERDGIDRAAFKSGVKLGGSNYQSIWQEEGNIREDLDFSKSSITLNRTGMKLQTEIPYNPEKEETTRATQPTKLITADILHLKDFKLGNKNLSGSEIRDELNKEIGKLYKIEHDSLVTDLSIIKDKNGKVSSFDISKLRDALKKEAIDRNYSFNDTQFLKLGKDNKFEFPLWANGSANKFEALLNSIINNRVIKQTTRGFSGVLASEEGFKGIKDYNDLPKKEKSNIIFKKGFDVEKGLEPGQIIAPFRFLNNEGKLLNVKDFIDEDGNINAEKLPDELRKTFGFRIPTSKHSSMSAIEIVGFLPENAGDTIIATRDFIAQMGSDFDVDKLNNYIYNTSYKNGKLSKYESKGENDKKAIQNNILDIHLSIMDHSDVKKRMIEPIDYGKLRPLSDKIYDSRNKRFGKKEISPLSDEYQKNKYLQAGVGKQARASTSLDNTFNAVIQGHNLYLRTFDKNNKEQKYEVIFKKDGITHKLSDLSNPKDINDTFKSISFSAIQNASIDNENEQILHKINYNDYTANTVRALYQLGLPEDITIPFIAQDILFDYTSEMQKLDDITNTKFYANKQNEVIDRLIKKYDIDRSWGSTYNKDYPLSEKELKDMIIQGEGHIKYKQLQFAVLNKFVNIDKLGKAIKDIQIAINADASGISNSMIDSSFREEKIDLLSNKETLIANVTSLLGEYDKQGNLIPKTVNGFASVYGLKFANSIYKNLFPYQSTQIKGVFKDVERIRNRQDRPLTVEEKQDIWKNIKSYLFANTDSGLFEDVDNERFRLFSDTWNDEESIGNKSLARRIDEYKSTKEGSRNPFIVRLLSDINKGGKIPSFVKYLASTGENEDETTIHQGSIDLFLGSEIEKQLGYDLISAEYLRNGSQDPISYLRYVPADVLMNMDFSKSLRNIDFESPSLLNNFTRQQFQHEPDQAIRFRISDTLYKGEGLPTKFKLDNIGKEENKSKNLVITDNEGQSTYPEYLSIQDDETTKGYRLYEYLDNYEYQEIPTLGNSFLNEFNPNEEFQSSIIVGNNRGLKTQETRKLNQIKPDERHIENTAKNDFVNELALLETTKIGNNTDLVNSISKIESPNLSILRNWIADGLANNHDLKFTTNNLDISSYDSIKNKVTIDPSSFSNRKSLESGLIHESIHAVTSQVIKQVLGKRNFGLKLDKVQIEAVKNLEKIFDTVRKEVLEGKHEELGFLGEDLQRFEEKYNKSRTVEDENSRDKYYGLIHDKDNQKVLEEFVTQAFTSDEFQNLLNNIKYEGGSKTLFDRFIQIIQQILGGLRINELKVNEKSALEESIKNIVALTGDFKKIDEFKVEEKNKSTQTIAMNFKDGDGGREMRPEFKGKSTIDLVLSGDRTGTTRDMSKSYNKLNAKVGGTITFKDDKTGRKVDVIVTSLPKPLYEINREEWSKREGWSPKLYDELVKKGNYEQFTYKLVNPNESETEKDLPIGLRFPNLDLLPQDQLNKATNEFLLNKNKEGKIFSALSAKETKKDIEKKYPDLFAYVINIGDNKARITIHSKHEDFLPNTNKASDLYKDLEIRESMLNKERDIQDIKTVNGRNRIAELEGRIKEIQQEKALLEEDSTIKTILSKGTQDMMRMSELFNDENNLSYSDLEYIKRVTSFWKTAKENLFSKLDISTRNTEGKQSLNVLKINQIKNDAVEYENRMTDVLKNMIYKYYTDSSKNPEKLVYNQFFAARPDISSLTMNFMYVDRIADPIAQIFGKTLQTSINKATIKSISFDELTDHYYENLRKEATYKSGGWEFMVQRDEKGNKTGNIVGAISQKFYNEKANSYKNKSYNKFKKDNTIILDPRKLFYNDYSKVKRHIEFTKEEIETHEQELIKHSGKKYYELIKEDAKNKLIYYSENKKAAFDRIDSLFPEGDNAFRNAAEKDVWLEENSPYRYMQFSDRGGIMNTEGVAKVYPRGDKYLMNIPRRFDKNGKETGYYDNKFDVIQNNENLKGFYDHMMTTLRDMYKFMPYSIKSRIQSNYLPEISKTVLDEFSEKGMKSASVLAWDKFIKSITTNETSLEHRTLDPITGKPISELHAPMVGDKLSPNEKSYDMVGVLKTFTRAALLFREKMLIEDQVKGIYNLVNEFDEQQMFGNHKKFDKQGNPSIIKEGGLSNYMKAIQFAYDSFYGQERKEEGISNTEGTREEKLAGKGKAFTSKEKQEREKLREQLKINQAKFDSEQIDKEEFDASKLEIEDKIIALGHAKVISKMINIPAQFLRMKGMGWNIPGAINNLNFAILSNLSWANAGEDFTVKQYGKATIIMLNSVLKASTLDLAETKMAKKINKIMTMFFPLHDPFEGDAEGSGTRVEMGKKLGKLAPYEFYKRGEYLGQGTALVSMMLNRNIEDINGKEVNLFDALDENGKLDPKRFSEETIRQWTPDWVKDNSEGVGKGYLDFKTYTGKVLDSIHGNYNPTKTIRFKASAIGRLAMMYRSWIPEGVANRFEAEHFDETLGRVRKGRYVTYKNLGLKASAKELSRQMLNLVTFNLSGLKPDERMSKQDQANMKKNFAELSALVAVTSAGLLIYSLTKKDKDKALIANALVNQAFRLQNDIWFYANPLAAENIVQNALPAVQVLDDIYHWGVAAEQTILGNGTYKSGVYEGQSKLLIRTGRLFPLTTQIPKNIGILANKIPGSNLSLGQGN